MGRYPINNVTRVQYNCTMGQYPIKDFTRVQYNCTMGQYPINNKQYNGNGPISHYQNAQYTCSVNVNKFNVKSLYECAICARTSAYHKHPFEVGFDDNATCTSVHPPPIGRPTLVTASKLHLKQSPLTNGNAEEITGD